jgi:hypothetical protein
MRRNSSRTLLAAVSATGRRTEKVAEALPSTELEAQAKAVA